MDNELQKKKPKEKDRSLDAVLVFTLAAVILFIVELYLMIAMPDAIVAIALAGVCIAGCVLADLVFIIRRARETDREQDEQYAAILKSEKASYLLIRKYFDEIENQMSSLDDRFYEPFQEVVASQKAAAKVTITRNKENSVAILNSNDKLADLAMMMEEKVEALSDAVSGMASANSNDDVLEIMQKQAEFSAQLRELELSIKNEILQTENRLSAISPKVVMAPQVPQASPVQEMPAIDDAAEANVGVEEKDEGIDLEGLGDLPSFTPLDAVEDDMSDAGSDLGDLSGSFGIDSLPDEEPALEGLPDLPESEPAAIEEPELVSEESEPVSIDEHESEIGPIPELEIESEPEPEPGAVPPMPDLSDPNKVMSPDDIAALLSNMNADTAGSEPDSIQGIEPESGSIEGIGSDAESIGESELGPIPGLEAVSEPEPAPEPEAAPPMPDLSDPNKVMSPDDIAALFANLT